jgi:ParB family chromosome partitioning protein
MTKTVQKITLSASRDIPFSQLVLSQANVRRVKAGVSIEELAADIARRTLLQSITVRPVRDADGAETGMFEIPAGGRRFRALELLVKQKRLARTAPVPCVVRTDGLAEEDSLAENIQRAPLHPLMAFSVSHDHERQEQVWEGVQRAYNKEPYQIRRLLTEGSVRAHDKRAQYVGEAYVEAGGEILRDLFQSDDGGWLQDVGLLERLVAEKLERDAEAVRAEGWKWVEAATDFPYGHTYGLRLIAGEQPPLTEAEIAAIAALKTEAADLEAAHAVADELPEEVDRRLGEIETALAALDERGAVFNPADVDRAGAFVSIDGSGGLRVERGYVRAEDEAPVVEPEPAEPVGDCELTDASPAASAPGQAEPAEEDEGIRPLPDKLTIELTAYRTLALREALGADPAVAYLAVLHALCLKLFYRYGSDSCLDIEPKSVGFGAQAPGLADTALASRVDGRHRAWAVQMPEDSGELWDVLAAFEIDSREALFAHCVSLTVNAVRESWNPRPKALAHADRMAEILSLDLATAGWTPTVDNYLGRVTKGRILEAVREARGEASAQLIDHLKKPEMAAQAEDLLAGSGWLPEPLRTPGKPLSPPVNDDVDEPMEAAIVETALHDGATAIDQPAGEDETSDRPADVIAIAAE